VLAKAPVLREITGVLKILRPLHRAVFAQGLHKILLIVAARVCRELWNGIASTRSLSQVGAIRHVSQHEQARFAIECVAARTYQPYCLDV
jgi:hypothetical protein